jgi:hypothetical protein
MDKVLLEMSTSLDGYVGPDVSSEAPLGRGGGELRLDRERGTF